MKIIHDALPAKLIIGTFFAVAALAVSAVPLAAQQQQRPQRQQQQQQPQQKQQPAEPEGVPLEQRELTVQQVDAFIKAQGEIKTITAKMKSDQPDKATLARIEAAAKKAGFKDLDEFGDIGDNIEFVFAGIDPQNKKFSDPEVMIRKDIDRLNADKKVPAQHKKRMLEDMQRALQSAPKLKFPANAELVAKNYDRLKAVME